jgi:hypothetical protein
VIINEFNYLSVKYSCNCKIPSSVSGHNKTQKGPYSIVVKWRNKNSSGTTSSENVSPSSLVKIIIYVIYVAVGNGQTLLIHINFKQTPMNYSDACDLTFLFYISSNEQNCFIYLATYTPNK